MAVSRPENTQKQKCVLSRPMADETTSEATNSTEGATQRTADGAGNQVTGEAQTGAATGTAQVQAQTDITQTAEFKAALTAAIERKIPQLRKTIAKEVSGEKEGQPSVEELQQRSETAERSLRFFQARDQVEDFISDKKNSANIKNVRAFCRYFKDDFSFDDEGKVVNLREIYARAKSETPELLGMVTGSIDAAAGTNHAPPTVDMNSAIRRASGRG